MKKEELLNIVLEQKKFYSIWQEKKDNPNEYVHPTQKPVSILEKIIKIASNENDIVLDCFNGVGSTGVASLKNNRRYIGIEIDKTYMKATEQRLQLLK